jgi:lipopolysaccharide assembly protein A
MQFLVFLSLLIAIVAVIFALQNTAIATVSFLVWELSSSLALILLIAVFAGVLISFLVSIPQLVRANMKVRGLKKQVADLELKIKEQDKAQDILLERFERYKSLAPLPDGVEFESAESGQEDTGKTLWQG